MLLKPNGKRQAAEQKKGIHQVRQRAGQPGFEQWRFEQHPTGAHDKSARRQHGQRNMGEFDPFMHAPIRNIMCVSLGRRYFVLFRTGLSVIFVSWLHATGPTILRVHLMEFE